MGFVPCENCLGTGSVPSESARHPIKCPHCKGKGSVIVYDERWPSLEKDLAPPLEEQVDWKVRALLAEKRIANLEANLTKTLVLVRGQPMLGTGKTLCLSAIPDHLIQPTREAILKALKG